MREAIQNPDDVLITEGVAGSDSEPERIIVSAASVIATLLQPAQDAAAPAAAVEEFA